MILPAPTVTFAGAYSGDSETASIASPAMRLLLS